MNGSESLILTAWSEVMKRFLRIFKADLLTNVIALKIITITFKLEEKISGIHWPQLLELGNLDYLLATFLVASIWLIYKVIFWFIKIQGLEINS